MVKILYNNYNKSAMEVDTLNTIGNYFIKNISDGIALKENMIVGEKFRFTFLTERLVRLEYSATGQFVDELSQRVIFRKFPKVEFKVSKTETLLQVVTSYFTLNYDMNKNFLGSKLSPSSNLNITLNGTDKMWYYHHPEARNFGGIGYSLDNFSGNLKLEKGLYSTDGFAIIDDSDSYVLNSSFDFVERKKGNIDLYVFMYRKDLGLCLRDYYTLTGYPTLIPRYALGNWWNKNSDYSNLEIEKIITQFSEENIPLSVFLLSNKSHQEGDLFSFSSRLNGEQLRQFFNRFKIHLAVTTNPGDKVLSGTNTYQKLIELNPEIKGEYSFLPITNQKLNFYATYGFRTWLGSGVDAFYLDYFAIKDKKNLALLNHYAYAMSSLLMNKRCVVLSRNHGMAIHRDGVVFNGCTKVDWNTLSVLPQYQMSASNNGISYVASPIGGYYGGIETFELYIRYIQFGVFSSFFLLSSDDGKYYKREPWRWNVAEEEIIKKFLKLRHKLIPYLYTECYIYHKNGSPVIQPLYYKYPKIYDEPLYKNQYFFGSQMLVCPITKKKNLVMNRVVQRMFIPEGIWYELESGKKYVGNKYYMSFYRDEDYPVFCREGAIVPMSLDESVDLPISLEIIDFPGNNGSYLLYEDDGISNNYLNGAYSLTEYQFQYTLNHYEFIIQNKMNPGILPQVRNYKIRFKNTKMGDVQILVDGKSKVGNVYNERNDLVIEVNEVSVSSHFSVICNSDSILLNSMDKLINDDIKDILEDLEIETILKEKLDAILFSDLSIRKKRIAVRKLKRAKLEPKFIKMFLNLLEYIKTV